MLRQQSFLFCSFPQHRVEGGFYRLCKFNSSQEPLILIARALLKQPKILLFDEATSSLDAQTSEHFATTVNQLRGKVTMLFIAHALPKNLQVDEVVRIGAGNLTPVGTGQAGRID